MRVDFATDTGAVRSSNQDACRCGSFSENSAWAVVCDGMGGANGGNVASAIAVEQIETHLKSKFTAEATPGNIKSMILNAIDQANRAIYQRSLQQPELRGMGTTTVVLLAVESKLHVAHVGDSRAYMMNQGGLSQLTMDHSYVQDLVNFGQITKAEARTHPRRNIITRVLGVHDQVAPDYTEWEFGPGDIALACTDGLTNYMEDAVMEGYIESHGQNGEILASKLIEYAVNCGGADNITIAVISNS